MIEACIEYADQRAKEGLWSAKWEPEPQPAKKATEECRNWKAGRCTLGDKCPRKHVGPSGGGTPSQQASNLKPLGPTNKQCEHDKQGNVCPFGAKCHFAHRNPKNPPKDASKPASPSPNADRHANTICNACGGKGHSCFKCTKVAAHLEELKKELGYTGSPMWFMDDANSAKSKAMFSARQWFTAAVKQPQRLSPSAGAPEMCPLPDGKLPFKPDKRWLDGGWCWIGWGENKVQLRLYVDLGADCSFSTQGMYKHIAALAKAGNLGCARLASEVPKVMAESWDGARVPMKNWIQVAVTADNVQGVQCICVGHFVSFGREGEHRVLVAGRELAHALGYLDPQQQRSAARTTGASPESILGDKAPKRTYVLSPDTRDKIERNRARAEIYERIRSEGMIYVGDEAFNRVRPMQFVHEPTLKKSYMSSAALHQAGVSANKMAYEGIINELATTQHARLWAWMTDDDNASEKTTVDGLAEVDITRILRETKPLARVKKAKFHIIQSKERKVILGQDVLAHLESQDEDSQDPLQHDVTYDEEQQIREFLEAAFDQARINGLPQKYLKRYRKLVFKTYFFVFRLRLGKEDPAILPALRVKTVPGAKLRRGYQISYDKLTNAQLEAMRAQLDENRSMGVIGDAPLDAVLHSLLTVTKPNGGLRWVITCVTANDITIDFWWHQPDNATSQQQRMLGAKYYWLADLTKGYWQVRLHKDSQWLFCFSTPWGPMMYLRAPMGCKATGPWFDMCMARILEAAKLLRKGVEMVHDDHAGYSATIYDEDPEGTSHYHLLRRYLKVCAQHRIRISPKKFVLFSTEADIAGRLHAGGGLRPNPPRYQAVVEQQEPATVADVYNGMAAVGWNRSFIPNFATIEQPVRAFVMGQLGSGPKTKNRAKNIPLSQCPGWNRRLRRAYKKLKLSLVRAIKRSYRDPAKISFLMWDASKFAWSYTITQVAPEELAKP